MRQFVDLSDRSRRPRDIGRPIMILRYLAALVDRQHVPSRPILALVAFSSSVFVHPFSLRHSIG
jgi:hypothetical protein